MQVKSGKSIAMREKITIIDVARKAGVSKGTVDRVLHNRGEVSAKSAEKVRRAIEELNFHPNMYASLLASRKPKILACLMPYANGGEFWAKMEKGFKSGAESVSEHNILVTFFHYNQYDKEEFEAAAKKMLESNPAGVLIPALFQDSTVELTQKLHTMDIPYMYVDTRGEGDNNYVAFTGMPRFDSGMLSADLLTSRFKPEDVEDILVVRIKRDVKGLSDPTRRRREGFMSYIHEHLPSSKVHNLYINPSDQEEATREMDAYLEKHPKLKHIVMFNSRLHLIADSLRKHPSEDRIVIGFDDTPSNVAMMKEGLATMLIAQHIELQSAKAVEILSDHVITRKKPKIKDNFVHIDILTRYNIDNY